jgi:hypothetical protein
MLLEVSPTRAKANAGYADLQWTPTLATITNRAE